MKNPNRLKFLRVAVCAALLTGILFSFELWFPVARSFPRAPLIFELPETLVAIFERLLSAALVVSLILVIFARRLAPAFAISSLALLIFFDQTRLQPWVYQYLLLLVVISLHNRQTDEESGPNQTLGLAQIIVAGLYFWSGVQKLNFTFSSETLPFLLAPLGSLFPSAAGSYFFLGIIVALVEAAIGLGLFYRKTRNLSVCLAVAMHAIILGLLVAKNYNSIVWIWNAALVAIVVVLFWRSEVSPLQTILKAGGWRITWTKSIVAASVTLPILSFAGWWDMYLSGALYSGRTETAVMRINEEVYRKLPAKARASVFQTKTSGEKMLPLFEWAIRELNVPAYPERRASEQAARLLCRLTSDKTQVELIIKERPAILDGSYKINRVNCAELERR